MVTEQIVYAFSWAPWSSIIGGTVTALALSVILAILGVALGFTVLSPKSDDPASGLGVAFGVWGVVSVVLSMAGGGFVAGLLAGQRGLAIGFLVWALTTLCATCFSGIALGGVLKMLGAAVAGIGAEAATVVSKVGHGVSGAASGIFSHLKDSIHFDFDSEKIGREVLDVLRDTGVDTLQPEYLREQLREARSEVKNLLHQMALNPSGSEQAISDFLDQAKSRLDSLTHGFDTEDAVKALMNTRHIPEEEARTMVKNAITAYEEVLEKTKDSLAEARAQVKQARLQIKELAQQARDKADKMASAAAKTALAAAVALIIAACIGMAAGYCGANYASSWVTVAEQAQTPLAR